jgi:hypothetical protein
MEDKGAARRRKSFVLSAYPAHNSCALRLMDITPGNRTAGKVPHVEPFHAGVSIYGLISGTCTSSTSIARPSRQSS